MNFPFDLTRWNSLALLTCEQTRMAESASCRETGMPSFALMSNAGKAVAEAVAGRWNPCRVLVLCGAGNNGGDGYVAAEELRRKGWNAIVAAAKTRKPPADAARAAQEWRGPTVDLAQADFEQADIIIDALFGAGLRRPPEGEAAEAIEKANSSGLPIVAVDLPSGVDGDTGACASPSIKAALTVTFARRKPAHLLLPGRALCGDVTLADIGLTDAAIAAVSAKAAENSPDLWRRDFPVPNESSHKYSRGHVLVIGGANMTGAARLAVRAAQRSGAGMATLASPSSALPIYAAALESVIVKPVDDLKGWRILLDDPKKTAVLIGPGAGVGSATKETVLAALASNKPCVLDADALSSFADDRNALFTAMHEKCVITPHEGEFSRLFGDSLPPYGDKLSKTKAAAAMARCVVLLKGADTTIASPDGYAVVNSNAPPWLATAGSGDVLAGIVAGLISCGMPALAAASAGAWLHGEAANSFGMGMIAEDLISNIPEAIKRMA